MRELDAIWDEAVDGMAFANGTSGEMWMTKWCYRCTHDVDFQSGQAVEGCPIVLTAMMGKIPSEWAAVPGTTEEYVCSEFKEAASE